MNNTNDENNKNDLNQVENTKTDSAENSVPSGKQQGKDNDTKDDTKSLAKQIAKMRKRIDAEAGQKHSLQDELADKNKQIETLTEKLKGQGKTDAEKADELSKKLADENKALKARLNRITQSQSVSAQFSEAGVHIPASVVDLIVSASKDDADISKNMKAVSEFYDSVVADTKKGFLSAKTPRVTGSDSKPISRKDIAKIKDPVKRISLIKNHLQELK